MSRHTRTRSRGRIAVTALAAAAAAFVCLGSTAQALPVINEKRAGALGINATVHSSDGTAKLLASHHHSAAAPINDAGETDVAAAVEFAPARQLGSNQTFISTALASIHASQRASWEQGVTVQAILEWQYPDWSTFDAPGPSSFQAGSGGAGNRHGRTDFPQDVVLQAMRSVVAQDSNGRLGSKVTGDEDADEGSSLDSASNLESVLVAAYASGQISGASNALDTDAVFGKAAEAQYNLMTQDVKRGSKGIISQRMDKLQYWADTFYMSQPALAAYGLYTRNSDALTSAYTQVKLYLGELLYPEGSGSKTGLVGHIRNEDGSWVDPAVWLTGQGWGALGMLRVAAALGQSAPSSSLSDSTKSNIVDLLKWTSDLLAATHATFDSEASLWHNYVDDSSTFLDVSGSLAVAAATYRLATLAPSLVPSASLSNAEAVYKRVIPHLNSFGQFEDGLECVDALTFSAPGYTSVEALSFGVLLESARRDYSKAGNGQGTALIRTIGGLQL
ncbi:hypothetical protein CF319_g8374 [Tilletia indica]|nr:hypothetical protein CF319_g8374 [Tilletia indica]